MQARQGSPRPTSSCKPFSLTACSKVQEQDYLQENFFEKQYQEYQEARLKSKHDECPKCKERHAHIEKCGQ